MPTISGRHFYRFNYLKSDHWSNLRIEKLASVDACCERCGLRNLSNDVHHMYYRNLYDVKIEDLAVLCRACHDTMHVIIEAVKNEDIEAVLKFAEEIRSKKSGRIKQMGQVFSVLRKNGILLKPPKKRHNCIPPPQTKKIKPPKTGISLKIQMAFSDPVTKPLFIQLARVGFFKGLNPPALPR